MPSYVRQTLRRFRIQQVRILGRHFQVDPSMRKKHNKAKSIRTFQFAKSCNDFLFQWNCKGYRPLCKRDDDANGTQQRQQICRCLYQVGHYKILLTSFLVTGENRRFNRCILDWTNQCKSHLPWVAKSVFLQIATTAHISGPIYETFFCSGSLKPGIFGYSWQTALALIGPI